MDYRKDKGLKRQFLCQHVWDNFEPGFVRVEIHETKLDVFCKITDSEETLILKVNRNWDFMEVPYIRGRVLFVDCIL